MRILIAQSAKLGDMVCTTPMFRAAKQRYPDSCLFVMGSAANKELLAGNPYIDEYLVFPQHNSGVRAILREKKIDVVIMTAPNPGLLWELLRCRVKKIIVPKIVGGVSPYATKTYRLLSRFATRVPIQFRGYMPREYVGLLAPLGVPSDDVRKELAVSHEAVLRVTDMLAQKGYDPKKDFIVGIAPSTGANKIKAWGPERFAQVANYLSEKHNAALVIIAAKGEHEDAERMRRALEPGVRCLDLTGKLSIEELKALILLLSLYISSDTGPIHIAEAFDIPSVDVLGAVAEHHTVLDNERHRTVFAAGRGEPALHTMSASVYDPVEVRRQTDMVTVGMVTAEVEALLSTIK